MKKFTDDWIPFKVIDAFASAVVVAVVDAVLFFTASFFLGGYSVILNPKITGSME